MLIIPILPRGFNGCLYLREDQREEASASPKRRGVMVEKQDLVEERLKEEERYFLRKINHAGENRYAKGTTFRDRNVLKKERDLSKLRSKKQYPKKSRYSSDD